MSRRFLIAVLLVLIRTVNLFAQNAGDFEGTKAGDRKELIPGIFFRWCPAGSFKMGKDTAELEIQLPPGFELNPTSKSSVELTSGYWLAETEVTQGQWLKVMGTTPWKDQEYVKEGPDIAASYLSHNDAMACCEELTKQERDSGRLPETWRYLLPTEAQWEYACRAGTTTKFSFGDNQSKLSEHSWWGGLYGNGNAKTEQYAHQVGQKLPNKWGLRDIHGNVSEWCLNGFGTELPGGQDPFGPTPGSGPVLRGGSWTSIVGIECSDRSVYSRHGRLNDNGFRLAAVPCGVFRIDETVVAIHFAELQDEGKVVDQVWPGLSLKITAINGDRLQATNFSTGWIDSIHVASLERGIHVLSERIKRDPRDSNLYFGRASVWMTKQDYDQAISDLDESIRLTPANFSYHLRARAWAAKGELDKAVADYSEVIRLNPIDADAYDHRGLSQHRKGEYDKAIADYTESIRLDPKNSGVCNQLAWLYATSPDERYRDGKKAVDYATKSCELTAWKVWYTLGTLAAAQAEAGDFTNAVKWAEKSLELAPQIENQPAKRRLELYRANQPYRDVLKE